MKTICKIFMLPKLKKSKLEEKKYLHTKTWKEKKLKIKFYLELRIKDICFHEEHYSYNAEELSILEKEPIPLAFILFKEFFSKIFTRTISFF